MELCCQGDGHNQLQQEACFHVNGSLVKLAIDVVNGRRIKSI